LEEVVVHLLYHGTPRLSGTMTMAMLVAAG